MALDEGLRPDRPLSIDGTEEDQLGFRPLARRLCQAIVSDASSDGLVIGLEGRWGSGKSSLTSLARQELLAVHDNERPSVIQFQPWLIGNRDALLASLFDELRRAIDEICERFGEDKSSKMTAAREAASKLKRFASRLEPAGDLLELASAINPIFAAMSGVVKASAKAAKEASEGPSIAELKSQLDEALGDLAVKIVVVIDDVDRLEPAEIGEILRLVRSVADFKNVVYLLCYDPEVLAHALEVSTSVSSGSAYLEKIVQVTVPVPTPEPFLLRRWFERSLSFLSESASEQDIARLRRVIDSEGGRRLDTPRTVIRAINAVHFSWRALGDRVDLPDLVWLQLVRVGNSSLYRWLEDYIANTCAIKNGRASVTQNQQDKDLTQLSKMATAEGMTIDSLLDIIGSYVPGTMSGVSDRKIYREVSEEYWTNALKSRRLASPEHYRLFFALEAPPLALTDSDREEFQSAAASSPEALTPVLRRWLGQSDPTGLSKGEVLLERVRAGAEEELSANEAANLLVALSDTLDASYGVGDEQDWLGPGAWRQAERLLPILLGKLDSDQRRAVLETMFARGSAIGWLTSIFRTEYFAHGIYGDQKRPTGEWLLTEDELSQVTEAIIRRYEEAGIEEVVQYPLPAHAIFAWQQTAKDSFYAHTDSKMENPKTFLDVLEALKSHVTSSAGNYWRIPIESVAGLFPSIPVEDRLHRFATDSDPELSKRAKEIAALLNRRR